MSDLNLKTCRPREHLTAIGQAYPRAWKLIDQFRADRKSLGDWPEYVFAPVSAWYAIVSDHAGMRRLGIEQIGDVAKLAAIGAWRVTQGIYQFDPDLFTAVWDTPMAGNIPCEILRRIPEWCVYVPLPDMPWDDTVIHGFWAHLEQDANDRREELRLLLDTDAELVPIPIHLGTWTLIEAIERSLAESVRQGFPIAPPPDLARMLRASVEPMISMILYLCAENAEIGDGSARPGNPQPKKVKGGMRLFPADKSTTWDVGVRIGAALRAAKQRADTEPGGGSYASPRPHIRRAHWHTYRVGPGRVDTVLRWLAPIAVNVDDPGELPATLRAVD